MLQGSFFEKVFNLAEINNNNNNNNLECCRAYRCCSAFNELGVFHLVYYACHVKLNILCRIVIPDIVVLQSFAIVIIWRKCDLQILII